MISYPIYAQEASVRGMSFDSSGSRVYVVGPTTATVYQYNIGTGGLPEYRICADESCTTSIYDWGSDDTLLLNEDDFIQVRLRTPTATNLTNSVLIRIGNITLDWFVDTVP